MTFSDREKQTVMAALALFQAQCEAAEKHGMTHPADDPACGGYFDIVAPLHPTDVDKLIERIYLEGECTHGE